MDHKREHRTPPLVRVMGVGRQQHGDDLGLEDLFAEMTEEGLEQRSQTQEMPYGDEASPDVLIDDDHELFEDYIEIDDTQGKTTRTRGGCIIKLPTHL